MHTVNVHEDQYQDCLFWCLENFGALPVRRTAHERWGVDIYPDRYWFYFRDEKDATLFILRWT